MPKKTAVDLDALIPPLHEKYPAILIFGPPGSGKGTLGRFLSSAGSHFHLSSGDIFRGLSPESSAGKLFQKYAHKGHLLPDDATVAIFRHYIKGLVATNRYFPQTQLLLLDGIPRTAGQVEILRDYLDVLHIVVLDVSKKEELIRRIKRRALIERRSDDLDEEVLFTRMKVYEKETKDVLSAYPKALQSRFSADQKPLEVLRDVLIKLSHLLSTTPR